WARRRPKADLCLRAQGGVQKGAAFFLGAIVSHFTFTFPASRFTFRLFCGLFPARRMKPRHAPPSSTQPHPVASARSAGLRYVSDEGPGIQRLKAGAGFRYRDPKGRSLRQASTLKRIRSLAIPPAWTDVWICPHA